MPAQPRTCHLGRRRAARGAHWTVPQSAFGDWAHSSSGLTFRIGHEVCHFSGWRRIAVCCGRFALTCTRPENVFVFFPGTKIGQKAKGFLRHGGRSEISAPTKQRGRPESLPELETIFRRSHPIIPWQVAPQQSLPLFHRTQKS